MKAPNKIYVEVCDDGIFAFPEPPFAESVEYIRADLVEQPLQQEKPESDLEKEIGRFIDAVDQRTCGRWNEEDILECARHFAEWGRKQILQEIYDGKVKPVDKITSAWLDD